MKDYRICKLRLYTLVTWVRRHEEYPSFEVLYDSLSFEGDWQASEYCTELTKFEIVLKRLVKLSEEETNTNEVVSEYCDALTQLESAVKKLVKLAEEGTD